MRIVLLCQSIVAGSFGGAAELLLKMRKQVCGGKGQRRSSKGYFSGSYSSRRPVLTLFTNCCNLLRENAVRFTIHFETEAKEQRIQTAQNHEAVVQRIFIEYIQVKGNNSDFTEMRIF